MYQRDKGYVWSGWETGVGWNSWEKVKIVTIFLLHKKVRSNSSSVAISAKSLCTDFF